MSSAPGPAWAPPPSPRNGGWWTLLTAVTAGLALILLAAAGGIVLTRAASSHRAVGPVVTTAPTPARRSAAEASASPTRTAPSTLAPSTSPSSATSSSAGSSSSPDGAGVRRGLTDNSLYGVALGPNSATCSITVRRPKPPIPDRDLGRYLNSLISCLVTVLRPPLVAAGFELDRPTLKTYRGTVSTPCGKLGSTGAPATYCGSNQTIYWPLAGDDAFQAYTYARLGYLGTLAHEFGHHVQFSTGMLFEYGARYFEARPASKRNDLSRRLELQAQCFEGVFLAAVGTSIHLTDADRQELRAWHSLTGDEDPPDGRVPDHGTSRAQIAWLFRGLDSADYGRCNTWTASSKSVT